MTSLVLLTVLGLPIIIAAEFLNAVFHRPATSSWKRTQCGGPSGAADIPSKWAADVSASSTPLAVYPRPQMVRGSGESPTSLRHLGDARTWTNMNGLWEWEKTYSDVPPYGKKLNGSILVPFPVESCLSGVAPQKSSDVVKQMWYRLVFDLQKGSGKTLLHFGAVDWQATVYLNGAMLGKHTGGYDGFSFDVSEHIKDVGNELLVYVYDPSDSGSQPNGKQRISAIDNPGGDTYTPSSGIWQTVWLENVPNVYIQKLKIDQASENTMTISVDVSDHAQVQLSVMEGGSEIASGTGSSGQPIAIKVPSPKLWSPDSPHLYDLRITAGTDIVLAYFGLRTFVLGEQSDATMRPHLNGKGIFAAGFLDQSWWPDGQYTAPTDEALESDLIATRMFGLNMIRLHQKVNPERWYYHADRHGILLFQDMVQKYGGANNATVALFVEDLKAMINGRGNHPCIVQWTTFNEADCWEVFKSKPYDVKGITELAKELDPSRLVDTDSGGGANNYGLADVNDIHSYPDPGDPKPSKTQYAMIGEFGGIGAFIHGKEWVPGKCHTYLKVDTAEDEATKYIQMAATIRDRVDHISASVYTQTTDVELECDGFLNYDRSNKFNSSQTFAIFNANQAIIKAAEQLNGAQFV